MSERPRLKIELNQTDEIVELAGWLLIVILWGMSLYSYANLPDKIPTHFNFAGQPDKWGSRNTFFLLPVVGTLVFTGLTVLNKYPHVFNYPVKITNENALSQYTNATRMLRWLKLSLAIIWCLINLITYSVAKEKINRFSFGLLPIPLVLILVPTVYFTVKAKRMNKKK
jgi:uncharacterized membrane protein